MATNAIAPLASSPGWSPMGSDMARRQLQQPDAYWQSLGFNGPAMIGPTGDGDPSVNPDLAPWMAKQGYQIGQGPGTTAGVMDRSGNLVPGSAYDYNTRDTMTQMLAPVAMAVGGQYAFGGGFGGAGAGAGAGAGGSMGGIDASMAGFDAAAGAGAGAGAGSSGGGLSSLFSGSGGGNMGWADWAQVGASLLGSGIQSNAAENAAAAQQAATQQAIGEQRRQYDLNRGDQAPYREAGVGALGTLQQELGRMPTAEEVMAQPGYQFGLQQGQQALDRKRAAMGGRVSGAALKAASEYATNYAANGYNAEYQRRQDRLARLQTLAGLGQSATSNVGAAGQNSSNAISGILSNQGDATAAAGMAQGNIWANGLNQIGAITQRRNRGSGGMSINNSDGFYNLPDYLRDPG
jgi:hypothetical protein